MVKFCCNCKYIFTMNGSKFYEGYEKLKTVGQGAFGTATLYRRINDGKHVVIKEVYTVDLDNNEKKSALNEVDILSTLNHPNIIKYLGSFQNEASLIIVMEYADGGNLAQLINAKRNKNETFLEKSILNIVSQTSAAISYMHSCKILHRDLKAANIFLSMTGLVKVGDFGISKALNTRSQAQTVVGTPYYLSPEMCEGSDYNEKSDVWAIGCILYELACLKKPFEAPTLPVLVKKIIACEYDDIPDIYSKDLWTLIRIILQVNPNSRPTARFIHDTAVPKISSKIDDVTIPLYNIPKERSILYKICDFGEEQKVVPVELPHKKIIDFSLSSTHQIVVMSDGAVYTWGENNYGQLALGATSQHKKYPSCVSTLRDFKIKRCAAGKGFSLFLTEQGALYSCGNGSMGCLGHGDWNSVLNPTLIASLSNIAQIACGDEHVLALSADGKVFSWGSSKNGELGQGHYQCRCKPMGINITTKIKSIHCGSDASLLITSNGQVLASGSNGHGKLGFGRQQPGTTISTFAHLKLKAKIKSASLGPNHTILLSGDGTVTAMGRNVEAQLGQGTSGLAHASPQVVKLRRKITALACGLDFTVACDSKSTLWFWGSLNRSNIGGVSSLNKNRSNSVIPLLKNGDDFEQDKACCVKYPTSILALYASEMNIKDGNFIQMGQIQAKNNDLFAVIHTTAPPPLKQFTVSELHNSISDQSTMAPSTVTDLPNIPRIT